VTAGAVKFHAPSRRMRDPRRLLSLSWALALTDWRLRFYGSVLGYLWSLARPFAMFGVIYFVFTEIVNLGNSVPHYAVYILFGMVLFQFFGEITGGSVACLLARENLLRKVRFPRLVIPLAVVFTALLNLGMTLVAVLVFALLSGVGPYWSWLELPVLVGMLGAFATGIGMLLSVLYVRYRDVQPIWDVVSQMLFYASPVLYLATTVPEKYRELFMLNPIAVVLTQMRHAMVDPTAPTATTVMGSGARVLIPLALVAAACVIGLWAFRREAPRVAENL
jgi:ABC-2 type transport system permease protein